MSVQGIIFYPTTKRENFTEKKYELLHGFQIALTWVVLNSCYVFNLWKYALRCPKTFWPFQHFLELSRKKCIFSFKKFVAIFCLFFFIYWGSDEKNFIRLNVKYFSWDNTVCIKNNMSKIKKYHADTIKSMTGRYGVSSEAGTKERDRGL